MNSPTRIPLTTLSELFWLAKHPVPFNFAMVARIRGHFSAADLTAALRLTAAQHPLARTRLEIDPAGQGWLTTHGVAALDLRVVEEPTGWEQVVEEELGRSFDPTAGPHVRAVWLRGDPAESGTSYLVLIFNHNACDGMSGAFFTRDVLMHLGDPKEGLAAYNLREGDLINLIPGHIAAGKVMRLTLWAITALAPLGWIFQKAQRRPAQPEGGPRFCIISWSHSPAYTTALVERCHAEHTSLHGAVCAAWLRADAEISAPRRRGPRWLRTVSTPVNLRGCLTEPVGESFGLFMSSLSIRVDCSGDRDFWEIARDVKRRLNHSLAGDRKFHWALRTHAALRGLSKNDRRGALTLLSEQRPGYDLAVTNLGRLDFPTQSGSLRFDALYGPLVNGFPFERTVSLLTFGQALHCAFIFRDFVMDRATAGRIQSRALEILAQAVAQT